MIGKAFLGSLALLAAAAASQASVTIESTSIDTPGLPGFKTWTLTAVSTDPITAIDFVGDGRNDASTGKGFFGRLNHVGLPTGPTIFEDFNALIPIVGTPAGSQVAHDSQFKVNSAAVVVPPGLAEEAPNLLQAAWAWSRPQGLSVPIAQLVVPTSNSIDYRGTVTTLVNGVQTDLNVSGIINLRFDEGWVVVHDAHGGTIPAGSLITHQFFANTGIRPVTWSNLIAATPSGGLPINVPMLTSEGLFTWQSDALDVRGTYHFDVTATNVSASDVGRLTIVIIPEPATWMLLATVGLVRFRRARCQSNIRCTA